MVTKAPSIHPSPEAQQKAGEFIEWVKAGKTPPSSEPLTPEIAKAVEQQMNSQDAENKAKIRQALDALKASAAPTESTEWSLSPLFEWAKSDLMRWAPKLLDAIIDPQLSQWKPALTPDHRQNIKLATLDRIVSWAASQALFGALKWKLDKVSEKFSKIDIKNLSLDGIDSITKELSLTDGNDSSSGDMHTMIQKQIETILSETLGQIRQAHESNPQPVWYLELLSHPKALAEYKSGEDIPALLSRSGDATLTRLAYREGIKQKILSLESSILSAEVTKNKVMNFLTNIPETGLNMLFDSLKWLFKIPILGDLIAAFFGYNSGKNLIDNLKLETRERKSVQALLEYGIKRTPLRDASGAEVKWADGKTVYTGAPEKWSQNGKIKLLENIDFSSVDFSNLKPFYKILREHKVDTTKSDFWKTVFVDGKIETGEWDQKKTLTFPKWEEGKETTDTIVKKLNTETGVPSPVRTVEKPRPAPVWALPEWNRHTPPSESLQNQQDPAPTLSREESPRSSSQPQPDDRTPPSQRRIEQQSPVLSYGKALEKSFMEASSFPFEFSHAEGVERVSSEGNIITIGNKKYALSGKLWFDIPANSLSLSPESVTFRFPGLWGETVVTKPKQEFLPHIEALLTYNPNERKEIATVDPGTKKTQTLVVKRIA